MAFNTALNFPYVPCSRRVILYFSWNPAAGMSSSELKSIFTFFPLNSIRDGSWLVLPPHSVMLSRSSLSTNLSNLQSGASAEQKNHLRLYLMHILIYLGDKSTFYSLFELTYIRNVWWIFNYNNKLPLLPRALVYFCGTGQKSGIDCCRYIKIQLSSEA